MPHAACHPAPTSLIGTFLKILRTATLERMVLPDLEGIEIDEQILLKSHLAQTPPLMFDAPKRPLG